MLIHWYRLANWLFRHHIPVLPKIIYYIQYLLFNSSVPASCTVVTKSMPPYCVVAGVPAKPIKRK